MHLLRHKLIECIYIFIIVEHEIPDFIAKVIDLVQISAALKGSNLVVRQECTLDIILGILEIQNKGTGLATSSTVQARECLNSSYITQFLIHIHSMKQRFIKAGLILFRHDKNIKVLMEFCFGLVFGNMGNGFFLKEP